MQEKSPLPKKSGSKKAGTRSRIRRARKKGLSQIVLKVFVHLFQKVVGCRGNALTRGPEIRAERELSDLGTPKTQKEFLFLVLLGSAC